MRSSTTTTPYEVLCPRCNVTFPLGARHCIHCGGPLGRPRGAAFGLGTAPEVEEAGAAAGADELPRRPAISPVAVLWALLIAGGAIYRTCAGG